MREWICWVGNLHVVHRRPLLLHPPIASFNLPLIVACHPNRTLTRHIQEGEGPMEPTTTLVLSAPSNTFLDVRLLLPTPQTPPSELPLPNTGGPLNRLDWAFSGVSETLPPLVMPQMQLAAAHTQVPPLVPVEYGRLYDPNATGPWGSGAMTVPRKRWRHVIDSRCVAPDQKPAQDEGEMYAVAGRPEACLEIGRMERERGSGVSVGYQELWVTVEPRVSLSFLFLSMLHSCDLGSGR